MESNKEISPNASVKPLKILIADDDEPTRMLLNATVSQWGYEVIEAVNGEEAWELLQETKPELLILDWLMPKLDGIELCKRARAELAYRPYIIMLTQIAGTVNIITGLEAGADEFLSKPFNIAELHTRILVGIRILKYETQFVEQITRLEMYGALAKEMLAKIDAIHTNPQPEERKILQLHELITVLQNNLQQMINLAEPSAPL